MEVKERHDSAEWMAAMDEEMNSHDVNKTWTLVELPYERKPIKSKWVLKTKLESEVWGRLQQNVLACRTLCIDSILDSGRE